MSTKLQWIETLELSGPSGCEDVEPERSVELEQMMYKATLESVKEGYRRLAALSVPASRPVDFLAEMLKADDQMTKVRAKLMTEQSKIETVEKRKMLHSEKRFLKKARSAKQDDRAKSKQKALAEIDDLKSANKKKGIDVSKSDRFSDATPTDWKAKKGKKAPPKKGRTGGPKKVVSKKAKSKATKFHHKAVSRKAKHY